MKRKRKAVLFLSLAGVLLAACLAGGGYYHYWSQLPQQQFACCPPTRSTKRNGAGFPQKSLWSWRLKPSSAARTALAS